MASERREPTIFQDMRIQGTNGELLRFSLILGVPNAMRDLHLQGGPLERDWESARTFAETLATQGDNLLYKSKKKGETAALMAQLIRALAVMAYVPGGVTAWGLHFDAGTPDNPDAMAQFAHWTALERAKERVDGE